MYSSNNRDFNNKNNYIEKKTYDFNALKANKYREKNGDIRENLIMIDAVRIAEVFDSVGLSNSQVRMFFGEIKALEGRLVGKTTEEEKIEFAKIYPFILMLNSKVEYKLNRKHVTEEFKQFINTNIDIIREENKAGNGVKSFSDFVMFFETVVGFFKGKK